MGAHVERQITNILTASPQSALRVGLVDLTGLFLDRRLRTLAVSQAALKCPKARMAERPTSVLPIRIEPTVQCQVEEKSHKESRLVFLPPTLDSAKSSYGGANVENRHDEYDRIEAAGQHREGQKICDKRGIIPKNPNTSSDEDGNAGDDERRKKKTK